MNYIKRNFLWKTYKVKFETQDRSLQNYMFFRGFVWDVVQMALEESAEKTKKEGKSWAVTDITRV